MSLRVGTWSINKPKKRIMKGKILNVESLGTKGKWYHFEITVEKEDGSSQVYNKFAQEDNAFLTVGDVGTYDEQPKEGQAPNMKNFKKEGSQGVSNANQSVTNSNQQEKPFVPAINPEKQQSIVRQSSLKVAIDYLIQYYPEKIQPEEVCKCADYFVYYVETGKIPEKPKLSEAHPEEVDDLPF